MRYVFLNPFSAGTSSGAPAGVDAYVRSAAAHLAGDLQVEVLAARPGMDIEAYQRFVRDRVAAMDPRETVVEAPEVRASSALIPREFSVHVRLHCPTALARYHNRDSVDPATLHRELDVIRRARMVSAPSHAMARELWSIDPLLPIGVFPHPAPRLVPSPAKDIDVLFVGRHQWLKGTDFLPPLLRKLNRQLRVVVAGTDIPLLRFPRSVRSSLQVLDTVVGEKRDELMRRARVVVIPSRFESFSMVAAEALAHGCHVVGWSPTALPELAPPPLVRVAPMGDVETMAELVRTSVGEQRRDEHDVDVLERTLDSWTRGFFEGIAWVIATHDGRAAPLPRGLDNRSKHANASFGPTHMAELTKGDEMAPPRTEVWQRKLRKLRRDPKAFVRDSPLGRVVRLPEAWLEQTGGTTEPRLLGSISSRGDGLLVERFDKKVAEPDLATVVFVPRADTALRSRHHLGPLLADQTFVGFRDRYLFAFEYDLDFVPETPADLAALFEASPEWTKRVTRQVRNIVFFDPPHALPFLVRSTDHEARLLIFATDETPRVDLLERYGAQIDVLVGTPGIAARGIRARRTISVPSSEAFVAALRDLIIDHKEKEKNVLIPVFGTCEYIDDIDALLELEVDAVLFLAEPVPTTGLRTFSDYLDAVAKRCKSLLLREVRFHQYRSHCEAGDLRGLLHVSLEDGCRYEVRT